jgi:pimeloyl-ACP methyl ester carboxylesterase
VASALPTEHVESTDGVPIAVHPLGGSGPLLLVSHATGFHGRCYAPLADALGGRATSLAFDYRGHGDTARPDTPVDWQQYGDDAVAMARWAVERNGGEPVDAFGHSMGGACLLMAAHRDPSLFRTLVVFEPIVFPPEGIHPSGPDGEPQESPMVIGARKRRATFPSYEAAIENYASKPPLRVFTPAALRAYVVHGFSEDAEGVHLKCRREEEDATFATAGAHDTWSHLQQIRTPTVVVAGQIQQLQPSSIAARVCERLPNGRYVQLDELDHFGPMTHPAEIADLVADAMTRGA